MTRPTLQIFCRINTTDSSACLGIEIQLDNQVVLDLDHVTGPIEFDYTIADDEADHCLEFVMKNKTDKDTTIDANGNIVKDARLIISDLSFDGIELKQIFIDQARYTHNFNGTQPEVNDQFYGEMGCNGRVSFNFSTPMYLWLLENM